MIGAAVGLVLEVPLIAALLRGAYRRWVFVFIYVIVDFFTSLIELPSAYEYWRGLRLTGTHYATLYWIDETVIQVLVYLVVISLIWGATAPLRSRRPLRTLLVVGAVALAGISLAVHYRPTTLGFWMAPWIRDLNFSSAILDLGVWALLIGMPRRDPELLLLSGGLGIQFAGIAIGESLQHLATRARSRPLSLTGSMIVVIANLLRIYIWWRALRKPPGRPQIEEATGRN